MSEWLKAFAYRIEIQWWLFALPGGMVLLIALLSASSQSWKAARKNPVDSLRYE
jgi:putative ABC transport system permease protein